VEVRVSDLVSRLYKPDPQKCCEGCVFGRGKHAEWCERGTEIQSFLGALIERAGDQERNMYVPRSCMVLRENR
jgi:hypothetical protein